MVRRLLTFVLAGIIALEAPMTAYASNRNEVVLKDVQDGENVSDDSNQDGNISSDNTDQDGSNSTDNTSQDGNSSADNTSQDGSSSADNTNQDGDNSTDSTNQDGNNSSDTPDNDAPTSTDGISGDETDKSGGSDESDASGDDEYNINEDNQSSEDNQSNEDNQNNEDSQSNEDNQSNEDIQDNEDNKNIEDSQENESDTQNEELEAEPADYALSADVITEIDYNKAVSEGIMVTAPHSSENAAGYALTVPEAGYYIFYTHEAVKNKYTFMSLYSDIEKGYYRSEMFNMAQYPRMQTRYMKKGEKVYLKLYNSAGEETFNLKVAKHIPLEKIAKDSYSCELPDGNIIEINMKSGHRKINCSAKMIENPASGNSLSGKYKLAFWPDYEDGYVIDGNGLYNLPVELNLDNHYENSATMDHYIEMDTAYSGCFVLSDPDNYYFKALLAGIDTLQTESSIDTIYIHSDICEENSITLDIETIADNKMYCYYAPADASEAEREKIIEGWSAYEFKDLRAGTEYTFNFYKDEARTVFYGSRTYSTMGEKVSADVTDYEVWFDDNFQKISFKAKLNSFNGKSTEPLIYYRYADSMGNVYTAPVNNSKLSDDGELSGYIESERAFYVGEAAILAGEEYDMDLWVRFPDDNLYTEHQLVKLAAPESPLYNADEVILNITKEDSSQNESSDTGTGTVGKTNVKYEITAPFEKSGSYMEFSLYYRVAGSVEPYKKEKLKWEDKDSQTVSESETVSGTIKGLNNGGLYEFVLYIGGLKLDRELSLEDDSRLMLERVPDETTDYTGAYDIIRTYKIGAGADAAVPEGDYYLSLEAIKDGEKWYKKFGSVQLTPDNDYQASVSTAALGNEWLQQDTDYTLKWILSSSKDTGSSAISVLYEKIHTKKAEIEFVKGETGCNYQVYTIALSEQDIVNLKAKNRSTKLYGYIRAEDCSETPVRAGECELNAENNYSNKLKLTGLAAETDYELIVQTYFNYWDDLIIRFATDSFTTTADNREIIATVETGAVSGQLNYSIQGVGAECDDYMLFYVREKGHGEWKRTYYREVSSASSGKDFSVYFSELKEECDYEYKIGFAKTYQESSVSVSLLESVKSGTFTTKKDQRTITVNSVTPKLYSVKLNYTLNKEEVENGYVLLYLRKKTEDGSEEWKNKKYSRYSRDTTDTFELEVTGLEENTAYEYTLGFGGDVSDKIRSLKKCKNGEFKTYTDVRAVTIAKVEPTALSVTIDCALSGMENAEACYLFCCIREVSAESGEGENVATWIKSRGRRITSTSTNEQFLFKSLKRNTSYEYLVGLGDSDRTEINDLVRVVKGETPFTTYTDLRKIEETVTVGDTDAVINCSVSGLEEVTYLICYVMEENGSGKGAETPDYSSWYKIEYKYFSGINFNASPVFKIEQLREETTYRYRLGFGNSQTATVDELDPFVEDTFTTDKPKIPSAITLSQTKLYLNANTLYSDIQGYGYQVLKPEITPATAAQDLIWKSADTEIAIVQTESGTESVRINAVAAGTVTITAAFESNPNVTASCEVVVGNYQIGHETESGNIELLNDNKINLEKGMQYQEYKLYQIDSDGSAQAISTNKLDVQSSNEAVALWDNGVIKAEEAGDAKLIFTTEDNVPSYLDVYVSGMEEIEKIGFTIVGFTTNLSDYPAKLEEEQDSEGNPQYELAYTQGITYTAVGESIPPEYGFNSSDYNWSIDDETVATVDDNGTITPHKAGSAVLSVTPQVSIDENGIEVSEVKQQLYKVILHIKELPTTGLEDATPVYALADISSKIGDVKFPDEEAWSGWQWKDEDTPLVINGVNKPYYPFEAIYTGRKYYNQEVAINVYIAKVTGVSAYESEDGNHNNVVEVAKTTGSGRPAADSDSITLTVESFYNGSLKYDEKTNYFYDVDIADVNGLVINRGEFTTADSKLCRTFTITAAKKGNYTLTPVIKAKDKNNSNEKILAKTSYKIKAVEGSQAYIELTPLPAEGISFDSINNRIVADSDSSVKNFQVQAKVTDRNGKIEEAFNSLKLTWSTTDKKVASIKAGADNHTAEVTIKGEGHAIITAKAKDAAGHSAALRIEIRNHAPRVDTSKAKVNLAYDYDSTDGRKLAIDSLGAVEVVPAYDVTIEDVRIYSADKKLTPDFAVYQENSLYKCIIRDTKTTKAGSYDCYLGVKTSYRTEPYFYPLKVTVVDESAKVTAKSNRAANLFYCSEPASIDISVSGAYAGIEKVTWTDASAAKGNGFSQTPYVYAYDDMNLPKNAVGRFYLAQENIKLTDDKKLSDAGIVSGFVDVALNGYKEINKGIETQIKWNYKKPVIITRNSQTTLFPSVPNKNSSSFVLYNKTDKRDIYYTNGNYDDSDSDPKYYYNELFSDNKAIKFTNMDYSAYYTYNGSKTKGSEKINLTIKADDWREPVSALHTIKVAAAAPCLSSPQLIVNTTKAGMVHTDIKLGDDYLYCDDIVIEGKNAKSKALLDSNMLGISRDTDKKYRINVWQGKDKGMSQSAIAKGTYSYKVTPYYLDTAGKRIEAKTLVLKIKVTDKEISAKTKVKGSLDLTKGVDGYDNNYIELTSVFSNIGNDYSILDSELTGEYSKYFKLYNSGKSIHRLTIADEGKLKTGNKYKLAIEYTIQIGNGDIFVVKGKTFTVKPKQTSTKIKVAKNNQTLYAAAENISRVYNLSVSNSLYRIVGVEGSIDCNKDGRPDIIAEYSGSGTINASVSVRIADADGVLAAAGAKGKSYSIPVTVKLQVRDGISKDVKTKIKVSVKR